MTKLIEIGLNSSNGPTLIKLSAATTYNEVLRCEDPPWCLDKDRQHQTYNLIVGGSTGWRFSYKNKTDRDDEYKRLRLDIVFNSTEENEESTPSCWWIAVKRFFLLQ